MTINVWIVLNYIIRKRESNPMQHPYHLPQYIILYLILSYHSKWIAISPFTRFIVFGICLPVTNRSVTILFESISSLFGLSDGSSFLDSSIRTSQSIWQCLQSISSYIHSISLHCHFSIHHPSFIIHHPSSSIYWSFSHHLEHPIANQNPSHLLFSDALHLNTLLYTTWNPIMQRK